MRTRTRTIFFAACAVLAFGRGALADPCGMVPPVWLGDGPAIERIGEQRTYVFYKDGIESFVIRPGFRGKVDEFGMLIPFPSPPAIRKVSDDIFAHVAAAVDPPEVTVDLRWEHCKMRMLACEDSASPLAVAGMSERREQVVVLREEAVGMYEVAVLEAGSAAALKRWMDEHGYRYPDGMDDVCEDYVGQGWCFVAVKTKVGRRAGAEPRPGMREVDTSIPDGAGFDGSVQAMGFRFRSEELVVPMRLSAFNEGELNNIVYILTDGPTRIDHVPTDYVVRQVSGEDLFGNVTSPLPMRVIGGTEEDIPDWRREQLTAERNPEPHNGLARELFGLDLVAVRLGTLAHGVEEQEKTLLAIGERLGLRGAEIDRLHHEALEDQRGWLVDAALADLHEMTLTVVHGDFPRDVLARDNLHFSAYTMPDRSNGPETYDARLRGPRPVQEGSMGLGLPFDPGGPRGLGPNGGLARVLVPVSMLSALAVFAALRRRRARCAASTSTAGPAAPLVAALVLMCAAPAEATAPSSRHQCGACDAIAGFDDPGRAAAAVEEAVSAGAAAVAHLLREAGEGGTLATRGWAIAALVEIGGEQARRGLAELHDTTGPGLVRTWLGAARIALAEDGRRMVELSDVVNGDPALTRPAELRWRSLLEREPPLELVLRAAARSWALQPTLARAAVSAGADRLLGVMVAAGDDDARRMAAAVLATLAQQGAADEIMTDVAATYAFEPGSTAEPWRGGALFVPSLAWTQDGARRLVGELMRWLLWAHRHGRADLETQIHNNVRSLALAHAAGYASPGWNETDVTTWLRIWGEAMGRAELASILAEQGVDEEPIFAALLDGFADVE